MMMDGSVFLYNERVDVVSVQGSISGSGCGCGATSGTDAGIYLGLLLLARYLLGRRRAQAA
jgi:MYXO-CTERM domain-containing protein